MPRISDAQREHNLESAAVLRDLIATLWLYIGRYEETQLTTEQKELLADVVELAADGAETDEDGSYEYPRWWRE